MSPSRFSLLHSSKFLELSRICFALSKSFRANASWNSLSDFFGILGLFQMTLPYDLKYFATYLQCFCVFPYP